ncbi:ras association domain-containing protein 2 [Tiliqua scincoides]|uniref:ras association domain-containing protein 2 n=1 Tax=Tiliqua scincoides TaxID=71010 RepID=UPI00346211D7
MDYITETCPVPCGQDKYISKNELLLHLKTYNLYYEGQNLQLRHREEEGEFIVEGLLNISWGLRRPIRLQMQDDNQRIRPPPSSSSWHSGCNLGAHGSVIKPTTLPDIQVTDAEPVMDSDGTDGRVDGSDLKAQQEDAPQLMRTRSDVGVRRRGNLRTPSEQRRIKRHRFSINGHFYNHKTSVFTPAYGSITNVRINSTMTTPQVLKLLLNKFKIENSAEEFALYIVHTSGEKQKLKVTDYPLIARILQGPCEQVCKVFLMEKDQVEEVTYDVAQYIKFEMPVLKSFIQKLKEEEDREVKKLRHKYSVLRVMIERRLEEIVDGPATM